MNNAYRLSFVVLAVALLLGTLPRMQSEAATQRGQCINEKCKPEKKSCLDTFKEQFKAAKGACANEGTKEDRRQCKKDAKRDLGQNKRACKEAYKETCKTCCGGDQIIGCTITVCGDGIKVAGEECQLGDDLACPGECQANCTCPTTTTQLLSTTTSTTPKTTTTLPGRFVDNGNGTITDNQTGLMWEKKKYAAGGLHDVYNRYSWAGCCNGDCSPPYEESFCQPNPAAAAVCFTQTGGRVGCGVCAVGTCDVDPSDDGSIITTIWDWLVQVKAEGGSGFAGHSDWRIPSEAGCNDCYTGQVGTPPYSCPCDTAELESILFESYMCRFSPCIDPIFGPTTSSKYWAATTAASSPDSAWGVSFDSGFVGGFHKSTDIHVRAVRGGL